MWQELRTELRPQGVEVVTVALDIGGVDAAAHWIDRAKPEHPSLIDSAHRLDELLGIVNVPMAVWIDEDGVLVRPPEVAHPGRMGMWMPAEGELPPDLPAYVRETIAETNKIRVRPKRYAEALRDWAVNGAASRFALAADDVIERSRPRTRDVSEAAAHFELGQHLFRAGHQDDARQHFRAAHRLDPSNWTYKRQAWSIEDPLQGPSEHYDSDWVTDVRAIGAENYYPLPDL